MTTASPPLDRKIFRAPAELAQLGILDFRRLHGYWRTREEALAHIGGLLCGGADYITFDVPDFAAYPERGDWPGWKHVGNHPAIGRSLWNWFHHHLPQYTLVFVDQPDLRAWSIRGKKTHFIHGDVGQVPPQAFVRALNGLEPGDMWISVLNGGTKHVVLTFRDRYRVDMPPATWNF